MSKRSFDDFNEFAANYRQIHTNSIKLSGADSAHFAEMKVKLVAETSSGNKLQLLDFGCGDGLTESYFYRYFPNWSVVGIDVSKTSIEAALQKNIANAKFEIFDGLRIPFDDAGFDVVFVAGVFHHIAHSLHDAVVEEIYRVLKPGGKIYLFEHNPNNPLTRYLVNTCVFDEDAVLLKVSYTKQLLLSNNFIIEDLQNIIFFPQKGFLKKLRWLEKMLKRIPLGGQYFFRASKPA